MSLKFEKQCQLASPKNTEKVNKWVVDFSFSSKTRAVPKSKWLLLIRLKVSSLSWYSSGYSQRTVSELLLLLRMEGKLTGFQQDVSKHSFITLYIQRVHVLIL